MEDKVSVNNQEFFISGKIFKILKAKNEWDVDINAPHAIIDYIKSKGIRADVFAFGQRLPFTKPIYNYFYEMDNVAAIPLTSYDDWWKEVNRRVRLKVNKAKRFGVDVRMAEFNDELIHKIKEIFDDSPLRQGVPFRHYKKPYNYIKERMGTFADRADFLCAYHGNEPIGILKLVYSGQIARMMTVVGKVSSREAAPVNAMLAKAVERCVEKGVSFLMYGKLFYGKKGHDSVVQFKIHNGFKKFDLPHYYVALSKKGKTYISLRLYRKPNEVLPEFIARHIRIFRQQVNAFRYKKNR